MGLKFRVRKGLIIGCAAAVVSIAATFIVVFYFLEQSAMPASAKILPEIFLSGALQAESAPISVSEPALSSSDKAPSSVISRKPQSSSKTAVISKKPVSSNYLSKKENEYINVGKTYIAEVICDNTETFNGSTTDNKSNPRNCYLPKGTVDFCSPADLKTKDGTFRTLRYGKRVLVENKGVQQVRIRQGTVPDTNSIAFIGGTQTKRYTSLIFSTEWKAPFRFEYAPQGSYQTAYGNYSVTEFTATYIDITFCYAVNAVGEIAFPADNPLFSSAEWIQKTNETVLRLKLRSKGSFYGWTASYNNAGNLIFEFLNPHVMNFGTTIAEVDLISGEKLPPSKANGEGELGGTTIVIDAGHGGKDPGAMNYKGTAVEAGLNLRIAKKLEKHLKELGAQVIMTRTSDQTLSPQLRMQIIANAKPDLVISLHYDASSSSKMSGYHTYYFDAFSFDAAKQLYDNVRRAAIYEETKYSGYSCHYFYLCRYTGCPVVLAENGFLSNKNEYERLSTDAAQEETAKALAQGTLAYFHSISK